MPPWALCRICTDSPTDRPNMSFASHTVLGGNDTVRMLTSIVFGDLIKPSKPITTASYLPELAWRARVRVKLIPLKHPNMELRRGDGSRHPQFKVQQPCEKSAACYASIGEKQEALWCLQASRSGSGSRFTGSVSKE